MSAIKPKKCGVWIGSDEQVGVRRVYGDLGRVFRKGSLKSCWWTETQSGEPALCRPGERAFQEENSQCKSRMEGNVLTHLRHRTKASEAGAESGS